MSDDHTTEIGVEMAGELAAGGLVEDGVQPAPQIPPRPRWTVLLVAGAVGLWVLGFVTTTLTSKLLKDHPLGLIALSPRYRNFILTASRIDLLPFLVVGVLRLLASDPLYFLIGKYYGDSAIRWFTRMMGGADGGGKLIVKTEQWFNGSRKWVAYVLASFFAGPIVCILAGAGKMRTRTFFILDALGTVVVVLVLKLFAKPLDPAVKAIVRFNGKNVKWITIVAIIGVVVSLTLGSKKDGLAKASSLGKD
jgi:membrane protein DedA with SNARE-associated domain